ncbi:MAG: hypothetical protein LUE64_03240 [Candidatus Gastranaerophilales bacterium]|nr:hypothetical protein [Candidatus Gastranaerophilales bacterium]
MFKNDTLTVKREVYELNEGVVTYLEPQIIYEELPCHLSIVLNATSKTNAIPFLYSDFTLFIDYDSNLRIKENDILYVTTSKNQEYKLYAGEVKIYNFSIQIKCRQEKIIESEN